MVLTVDLTTRCEWCGEPYRTDERRQPALKNGEPVSYHGECLTNDLSSLDDTEEPQTGIQTW